MKRSWTVCEGDIFPDTPFHIKDEQIELTSLSDHLLCRDIERHLHIPILMRGFYSLFGWDTAKLWIESDNPPLIRRQRAILVYPYPCIEAHSNSSILESSAYKIAYSDAQSMNITLGFKLEEALFKTLYIPCGNKYIRACRMSNQHEDLVRNNF
jgi:hypothetical protein